MLMTNLVQRVLVGLVGIPIAILLIWTGGWWFNAAIMIITTIALWEFYRLAHAKQVEPNVNLGLVWSVLLQYLFAQAVELPGRSGTIFIGLALLTFMLGTVAVVMAEIWRARSNATMNVATTVLGVSYISVGLTSLLFLRGTAFEVAPDALMDAGGALVIALFVSVWSCDSLAYFTGLSIGRHKLLERVSPKKTWEGAAGGVVGAVLGFWGITAWLLPSFDLVDALVCGGIVGVFGQIGDLAESWMKRDAVIKDSSHIIPGHGGFLDRFDSMLFAAPLVLIYLTGVQMVRDWLAGGL